MLNDRNNKYEGQEDSEYHFSDEDVSYEVNPEPSNPSPGGGGGPKENLFARLAGSKRMIISGVVFLVLVFVVYKMVAPTSTVQATDIAAPTMPVAQAPVQPVASPPAMTQAPAAAPSPLPAQPTVTVTAMPTQPVQQPAMPQEQPLAQQQPAITQPTLPQQMPGTQQAAVPTMPAVIPVEAPPAYMAQPGTATNMGALSAESQRLMNQFQTETAQRINDYAAQNKQLQEQMQTLNARVINMEAQLNQLVQALTQTRGGSTQAAPQPAQVPHQSAEQPRVPYNVQAIIPGRAWLRSDNGETVTVAEGDMIKDLGRVSKIDPYDGVVEVNTGTKVVSLSYGNGG